MIIIVYNIYCFEPSSLTAVKLYLKRKVMLKPDAVPIILHRPSLSLKTALSWK